MAIRILHQPAGAAVGAAAYAAGQGKARQRQQKYAMDLMRDERHIQARREELKYRAALGGVAGVGQRRLGQQAQAAGEMVDPAAGMTPQALVQLESQRKANERDRRAGRAPSHPEAEPQFVPAPTKEQIAREQELKDRKRGRRQELADEERERGQQLEDQGQAFRRSMILKNARKVPEHLEGTPEGAQLRKLYEGRMQLRGKHDFDPNRQETQDALSEVDSEITEILEDNPEPSAVDEYNRTVAYMDERGNLSNEWGEGSIPGRVDEGGEFVPSDIWTAGQASQQDEQARKQKQGDATRTRIQQLQDKEMEERHGGEESNIPLADAYKKEREKLELTLDSESGEGVGTRPPRKVFDPTTGEKAEEPRAKRKAFSAREMELVATANGGGPEALYAQKVLDSQGVQWRQE